MVEWSGALAGGLHGMRAFRDTWARGLRNGAAIRRRAESLAVGEGLPAGAPRLVRMESVLTDTEIPRLKARHSRPHSEEDRGHDDI